MKTLTDIVILRPAATPGADPESVSGATVAKLLAAAEVLDFANPDHQDAILEGVAELQRVIGDAAEAEDAWRPGSATGFLLGALLDALRLAMTEHSEERYGITGPAATGPRTRAGRDALPRPALKAVPARSA